MNQIVNIGAEGTVWARLEGNSTVCLPPIRLGTPGTPCSPIFFRDLSIRTYTKAVICHLILPLKITVPICERVRLVRPVRSGVRSGCWWR